MFFRKALLLVSIMSLAGCVGQDFDYTAFKQSKPRSILVLPPVNQSLEVTAGSAIMASSLEPLGESGYYVFPPTLTYEIFKENGLTEPADIHAVSLKKIRDVFNPDAVLYISIIEYGQKYFILGSAAVVTVVGRLVDARTGKEIWSKTATARSNEGSSNSGGGIAGLLVQAVIEQVVGQLSDQSYMTSKIAADRLLSANVKNSLLYGPRHAKAGKPGP